MTVRQNNIHTGSGHQFAAAGDQHIAFGGDIPWSQVSTELSALLETVNAAGDDPEEIVAVVAEIEAAQEAASAGSAPAVQSRLAAALQVAAPMSATFASVAATVASVTAMIGAA